jgi:hypothetical protein
MQLGGFFFSVGVSNCVYDHRCRRESNTAFGCVTRDPNRARFSVPIDFFIRSSLFSWRSLRLRISSCVYSFVSVLFRENNHNGFLFLQIGISLSSDRC